MPAPCAAPAVEAAVKIAAHDAIVSGFDAVAPSAVANARRGVADLGLHLAAEPHAERAHQRADAEVDQHRRADQPERHPQRLDLQQPGRAGRPGRGVQRVDHRHARADRQPDPRAAAQRRPDREQRQRPELRGDEEAESEADHELAHGGDGTCCGAARGRAARRFRARLAVVAPDSSSTSPPTPAMVRARADSNPWPRRAARPTAHVWVRWWVGLRRGGPVIGGGATRGGRAAGRGRCSRSARLACARRGGGPRALPARPRCRSRAAADLVAACTAVFASGIAVTPEAAAGDRDDAAAGADAARHLDPPRARCPHGRPGRGAKSAPRCCPPANGLPPTSNARVTSPGTGGIRRAARRAST